MDYLDYKEELAHIYYTHWRIIYREMKKSIESDDYLYQEKYNNNDLKIVYQVRELATSCLDAYKYEKDDREKQLDLLTKIKRVGIGKKRLLKILKIVEKNR